jgi:drug/metabolite transporter (DMT)-like permease
MGEQVLIKKEQVSLGILCALICQVLFGFSFLFTKKITSSVSPTTLLGWRFIVAFLVLNLCALTGIIKLDFKGKSLLWLLPVAIFQPVLYFIGETVGINLTSASESGTIIACIPIVTLLFSAMILRESATKLQAIGVIVTATGIVTVVLTKGLEATFNPIGYTMLLLAVISHSLYSVFARKATEFTSAEKTYAMMAFGAVVFTNIALAENAKSGTLKQFFSLPFTNLDFLTAILYLGIGCSVVGFLLYNTAITSIGPNRTASFVGISTIVTVTAGIIILKEQYSIFQALGTTLVIGGVYLANVSTQSRKSEIEEASLAGSSPSMPTIGPS